MVKKRTLRDILCENTKIPSLQKFVMKKESRNNPTSSCFRTNEIDFSLVVEDILKEEGIEEPKPAPNPKPPPIQKPKPQPVPKPKPPPIQKPNPQPVPKPKPPPVQKPKPQPVPKPKPPPVQKPN